jgi:hypothetical protein
VRKLRPPGSVRGALSNERPYRDTLGIISSVRKLYGNISAIMGCPFDVLALVSVTVLKRWSRMVFNS